MQVLRLGILAAVISVSMFALPSRAQSIACGTEYRIAPGDTLGKIGRRAYGADGYRRILEANRDRVGSNPDLIEVGDLLRVPCDGATTAPTAGSTRAAVRLLPSTATANFAPAPELANRQPAVADTSALPAVEIVFNKASAPKFIINVGIIDPFLADITRVTQGRVTFRDPETVERNPQTQLDLVRAGTFDGAYIFNGYLKETNPLVQITMHPMMGGSAVETAVALWRVHDEFFRPADNFSGVHLFGFIAAPPAHIWRVNASPVTEQEQLVDNNAWAVPYFDGLDTRGANAVRAENAERVRVLDETPGLPPATFALAHGAARAVGIWNQNRTVTEIDGGVYVPTFSVVISQEKWDQISPRDQAAINGLAGETLALRSATWDAFDNNHKSEMIAQGLNIVEADFWLLAELQDRARVSWEEWIAAADAEGISGYHAINAFTREVEALKKQFRN